MGGTGTPSARKKMKAKKATKTLVIGAGSFHRNEEMGRGVTHSVREGVVSLNSLFR